MKRTEENDKKMDWVGAEGLYFRTSRGTHIDLVSEAQPNLDASVRELLHDLSKDAERLYKG